jgi:hypothetical protein
MRLGAMRRARVALAVLLACGVFAAGVGSTFAWLDAETTNAGSAVAAGWIGPATGLGATFSRYDVTLGWTNATTLVNSQRLLGYDAGTTAGTTCAPKYSASYATTITNIANNTTHTYADANRGSTINGHYYCYELLGISNTYTNWQSAVTLPTVVGLAATGLSVGNGNGSLANNDTITITWNQRTNLTTTSTAVCTYTDGTILVGETTCPSTDASATYSIAKLTGASSISAKQTFSSSTVSSTTTAPFTTTITLKNGASSLTATGSSWTATPSSSIQSNATPRISICVSGGSCTPSTTTTF